MATLSDWIRAIDGSYPDPSAWVNKSVPKADVFRFVRSWLSEGIPYAFKDNPGLYELGREALASRLGEHEKHISITGSARLGYSLASSKFGKKYDRAASDLDLFVVSESLFLKLSGDAELWLSRYRAGLAVPQNDIEATYWHDNADRLPLNIAHGFIDHGKIPHYDRYLQVRMVSGALSNFLRAINSENTADVPFARASLRVYKDWRSAIRQIGGSVIGALGRSGVVVV